ncbi:MAG: hypothetical protein C0467_14065 [Planctomycetaceae bacterium]|nr:hypothetical protein [Planctomycetaceae bacterium]
MSETAAAREELAPYCQGIGLDIGFGGSAITPTAITMDMPRPYTKVGEDRQILRGCCKSLNFICDNSLDYIYSSHLLEDFTYHELCRILHEWRRCLKTGGLLITNCPDQQRFLKHCSATGQPLNLAHKEQDFSLSTYTNVINGVGRWQEIYINHNAGAYSFYAVHKKL